MDSVPIAVLGGSGFYQMESLEKTHYVEIDTPFGRPSEKILLGELSNQRIAFLSRHGQGHRYNPAEVNYRANLFALKTLGVQRIISVSAVGSLREELEPSHLVVPDQFVDNTSQRKKTFFENGLTAHVSMAEPFCPELRNLASDCALDVGIRVHPEGTYINMEGPQFSTKAESNMYRDLGFSVIGMTQAVEAKLARELEICFVTLAFVTDYDCWHTEIDVVSVDMIVETLNKNISSARSLIAKIVDRLEPEKRGCGCKDALQSALLTSPESISDQIKEILQPVLMKYTDQGET